MKYDVFISYSRKDSEIADQIYDCLEENNISAFIDREGISGGEEFSPKLAKQIKDSTLFLFIGSKHSYYESKWTPKELNFAIKHKERNAIIPYLIDDEVMPEDIEIALADINILNIKEHLINERLVEDIKIALEKLRPNDKDTKEDIKTAKSIAEQIENSSNDVEYKIKFLIELGGFNSSRIMAERLSEAEIYFTKALEMFEKYDKKELNKSDRYYDVYKSLADIKKEKGKYQEAEDYYQKYINLLSSFSKLLLRDKGYLIDSLISLAEVQCFLKKYDLANSNCERTKELCASNNIGRFRIIERAGRLVEIQVKALREQGKNEEANNVQDDILNIFRNQSSDGRGTFSELLVAFADSNKKSNQFESAKKCLEEAHSLNENDIEIMLSLAETYDALERKTDAYEIYKNAFSTMLKQSDASSRRFYYTDLPESLRTIVAFLDKNKYYDEIDRCYQLAIAKFQLGIYNDGVNRLKLGNIYEPYADWLISQKRFGEAKKYLYNCLGLLELMEDGNQKVNNCFRVRNKIVIIHYHLGLLDKAIDELKLAIKESKESDIKTRYLMYSLFETWEKIKSFGFDDGANLIKDYLVKDFSNLNFKSPNDQAMYYTDFGWFMLKMKEFEAATKPLEDALKIEQKQKKNNEASIANARNNLALLYINTQNFDKAEQLLKEACLEFEKLAKKDKARLHNLAESLNYFGQLSMAKGNYAEAEEYFVESVNNYNKAVAIDKRYMKEVEETTILLEKAKAMQGIDSAGAPSAQADDKYYN